MQPQWFLGFEGTEQPCRIHMFAGGRIEDDFVLQLRKPKIFFGCLFSKADPKHRMLRLGHLKNISTVDEFLENRVGERCE